MTQRSAFQRFLHELRRRHVPQTAAVYLVAGWAAIQFADVVVPNLNGPQWIVTAVIVAALVGLPIVLVLAWIFDWGPEGLHRTGPEAQETAQETASGIRPGTPWIPAVAVLVVAIASAVGAAAILASAGGGEDTAGSEAGDVGRRGEGGDRTGAPEPPAPPAVTPFGLDSIESEVMRGIDLSGLERLEALRQLGNLDTLDVRELRELSLSIAEETGLTILVAQPEEWVLGSQAPAPLREGDTLDVTGIARDTAGVVAVLVDGQVVAEAESPGETLRFSTELVGTGSGGIRVVPVVLRTVDGREERREYRIVQMPGGTP